MFRTCATWRLKAPVLARANKARLQVQVDLVPATKLGSMGPCPTQHWSEKEERETEPTNYSEHSNSKFVAHIGYISPFYRSKMKKLLKKSTRAVVLATLFFCRQTKCILYTKNVFFKYIPSCLFCSVSCRVFLSLKPGLRFLRRCSRSLPPFSFGPMPCNSDSVSQWCTEH